MVQDERFLDGRQAGIHVEPTRGDHVLLREVEEIDRHSGKIRSGSHARVPEPVSLGVDATPFPLSSLLTTMYSVVGRLTLNAVAARRTITAASTYVPTARTAWNAPRPRCQLSS